MIDSNEVGEQKLSLQPEVKKLKILVTGGTGFIGSELTRCLLNKGFHVTILSRSPDLAKKHFESTLM